MKRLIIISAVFIPFLLSAQEDHSEFIEGPFSSPMEVTETCLLCHDGLDQEIMQTRHWNWLGEHFSDSDGRQVQLGKRNIINNFCVAVTSNWSRCTSCHIGYGWKDDSFNFTNGNNIDCLVCHDRTGSYKKTPTGAGMPDPTVDLVKVAQSVGPTTRKSCGDCHFFGGGGNCVKHGDLDHSLVNPPAELDVHMGGLDFSCSDCHAGENHHILGAGQSSMAAGINHTSCTDCHEERPHSRKVVNDHSRSVACETCHIPAFARERSTKVWWDWSTAGKDIEVEKDEFGMPLYDKKKGDFTWAKDAVPTYAWHNGKVDYYLAGEKLDPTVPLVMNSLAGNINDEGSKITPFKLMRGKQIYDRSLNYLIIPKLYGEGGYWKDFDWNQAARLGMEAAGMEYSGEYGFVETAAYWPINHMVPPAEKALKCTACHFHGANMRLDWKELGYEGDPVRRGGRFSEQ